MRTNRSMNARMLAFALASVCGLSLGAPALAQNALGDGRALDANLRQGGSRYNPPGRNANIAQEARFRNSIVTGNAPGGLSFRGDAGYLSSDDFRADTGTNTLYDFQRDSLYSGLATRGVRNIDALRAQMSLATGGAPTFDTGGLFIQRAGAGASVADITYNQAQLSIDPFTTRPGSMRSTSTFVGTQSIEPQFFGSTRDQNNQQYAIGASPLRGLIAQPLMVNPEPPQSPLPSVPGSSVMPTGAPGTPGAPGGQAPGATRQSQPGAPGAPGSPTGGLTFNPNDLRGAEDGEEVAPRPGEVGQTPTSNRIDSAVERENLGTSAISNRVPSRSAYDSIMSEFLVTGDRTTASRTPSVDAFAAPIPGQGDAAAEEGESVTPEQTRSFLERVEDIRRELLGMPARDAEEDGDEGPEPLEVLDPETGEPIEPREPSQALRTVRERAAEVFGEAAAPSLDTLAPTGADTTIFNRYLREGEAMLRSERWFEAEEAFTAAINRRSGDPIASAGRVSAQLGASMYLSASVNLRALFSAHPEMAAVRFREGLFLSGDRLQQVVTYLRDEAAKERAFARDAALLLAYIGYQTENNREVRNAFAAYDRNAMNLAVEPDPLVEMLKGAWMDAPARRAEDR